MVSLLWASADAEKQSDPSVKFLFCITHLHVSGNMKPNIKIFANFVK